ncbi:hypothetical protein, partial [Microbulbifer celer]
FLNTFIGTHSMVSISTLLQMLNAALSRSLLCALFARKWERSDRAKSAQSKLSVCSALLECY